MQKHLVKNQSFVSYFVHLEAILNVKFPSMISFHLHESRYGGTCTAQVLWQCGTCTRCIISTVCSRPQLDHPTRPLLPFCPAVTVTLLLIPHIRQIVLDWLAAAVLSAGIWALIFADSELFRVPSLALIPLYVPQHVCYCCC